ncbi:MAG: DEAD/DEAH box helicase, partial [Actinomycetota bacterium]|nr:DEAD/DEAH box helicase [Actinomycetota bacterium]
MTAALDPLATTERITEHYLRYLRTTFAPNDPALRRAFEVALRDGIRLTRGPYLEATAPFRPGASVRDLVSEGVLSPELLRLSDDAVPLDRPLHGHQDTAIRKAVAGRRNLVVSTGTGSGKTETFLLPILDHLGREIEAGTIGTPGVRALLLYPMNALANDQVKRLRTLLADYPEITFGRFVGETKERPGDAADDFAARFPGEKRPVNELISRAEMRQTPPHILLTNYAMLEYLLLRPSDSPFFDGLTAGSWRFVVLDEAHVYGGAQGTEMAMLLRRLRDRIARSEPGRMQCFATSATLGSGEEDHPELVRFAGNLFDERFEWEADDAGRRDVVTATRRALAAGAGGHALPLAAYHRLRDAYRRGASTVELAAITADAGSAAATPAKGEERGEDEAPAAYLGRLLTDDARVLRLQAALDVRPVALRDAVELVGDGATAADVVALVDLCVAARRRDDDAPLLPARYHFFVRSLEGAFACFHPAHPAEEPALLLARHAHCPACEGAGVRSAMVELATCRRCGAAYAVGEPHRADERRLATAGERAERLVHLALDVAAAEQVDDEDAAALDIDGPEGTAVVWLGLESGVLHEREPGTEPTRRALRVDHGGDVLRSCVACGNRTNGEIVRRFLTGQDAPVSVIATDLYQQLPAAQDSALADEVGEGRKLLTFSDSRQDAAFFASYLERTYGRAVERGVLHGALRELDDGDPVMVEDLAARAHKVGERALVLDPEPRARRGNRRAAASWVMSEVLALDRRQSLDGLGLAEISVITPRRYEPPAALVRLGFTPAQAVDLLQLLLETIRLGGAVTAPDDVDLHDDRFAPRNHELGVRLEGSEGGVISWLPTKGENRRVEIVRKALAAVRSDADPIEVLRGIWRHLTDESSQWPALAAWQKRRHGRL